MFAGYVPAADDAGQFVIEYDPKLRSNGVGFDCATTLYADSKQSIAATDQMVNFFMDVAIEIVTECD